MESLFEMFKKGEISVQGSVPGFKQVVKVTGLKTLSPEHRQGATLSCNVVILYVSVLPINDVCSSSTESEYIALLESTWKIQNHCPILRDLGDGVEATVLY